MTLIPAFCEQCYQTVQVDPAKVGKYVVNGTEYVRSNLSRCRLVPPKIPFLMCWHITIYAGQRANRLSKGPNEMTKYCSVSVSCLTVS